MKNETFSIDNIEKLPPGLFDLICKNKDVFEEWLFTECGNSSYKSEYNIVYRNEKAADIFEAVRKHVSLCSIRAYHSTRIVDEGEILCNGLHPFEICSYISRICELLISNDFSDQICRSIAKRITDFVSSQDRKQNYISLFNSRNLYVGCYDQFSENYGGEIIRFALGNDHCNVMEFLRNVGKAVIIYCNVNWDDIESIYQNSYIQTVVSAVLSRYLLGNNDIEPSEIRIMKAIPSSCIERIEVIKETHA